MTGRYEQLARQTTRLGVQRLWRDGETGQHWLTIRNRSYHSKVPIPEEKVELWRHLLDEDLPHR